MGRHHDTLATVMRGEADANIAFDDLCSLLRFLGFTVNVRGSHHVFRRAGIPELINLQRDGSKAKVYQVRQVRRIVVRHGLDREVSE